LVAHLLIFSGSLVIAQDRFRTRFIDAQSHYEQFLTELDSIQHECTQPQLRQVSFAQISSTRWLLAMAKRSLTADSLMPKLGEDSRIIGS